MRERDGAEWLVDRSEMGTLIRATDWANTTLKSPDQWSPALRMIVKFLLANRFPQLLWWGREFCCLYNDAYIPILGTKHPWALGKPVKEVWSEIWHILKPLIETPYQGGCSTWMEDIPLEINRSGFVEETHFTVAYSPVPDETVSGAIGGVLATVHEITEKVIGERRVILLRDLGSRNAAPKSAEDACLIAAETLERHPQDVPFALLYLIDSTRSMARLVCGANIELSDRGCPKLVDLSSTATHGVWEFSKVIETEKIQFVTDLKKKFDRIPRGAWSDPPFSAALVPVPSNISNKLAALMIIGISSRLKFDEKYRDFLTLLSTQVATTIANARAYEEERRRAEALAEIDRAKTTFFSNVSHEFRTPLTLMLGPLQDLLARSQTHLSPTAKDQLEVVNRNGARLLRLVNTLLDFSRIEAGRMQAVYQATDLAQFTSELASVFRSATEKAGLNLLTDCRDLGEPVYIDRDMWEKIVLNLISNAFKFTFEGEIAVSVDRVDDNAQLRVRDTGVAIPPEEIPKLFERFHRVPNTRSRTHEGSGIGLALVHELVKLHGGSIRVESEVGRGTTFIVSIPFGQTHLASGQLGGSRSLSSTATGAKPFVEEALRWLPDAPAGKGEVFVEHDELLPVPCRQDTKSDGRPRILFADDNSDMRHYIARLLAEQYEVETAADGKAAFEIALAHPPNLILSDVMMPVLDGFEFLKAIRGDDRTRRIPVVLLSARAGEESRVEGMQAGADDYLIKPFSARELLARISARIEISRLQQENEKRVLDILETLTDGCYTVGADCRFRYVNPAIQRMWAEQGVSRDVLGEDVFDVFPDARDTDFGFALMHSIREQIPVEIESFYSPFQRWYVARHHALPDGGVSTFVSDITERKRSAILLKQQNHILEIIASGGSLEECLTALTKTLNYLQPNVGAAVCMADESRSRTDRVFSADIPASFRENIKGVPINELLIGTCSTVIFSGEPATCVDMETDERWSKTWRDLCIAHGVRAVHSTPVFDADKKTIASFAICFGTAHAPDQWERSIGEFGAHLASIAIERDRAARGLRDKQAQLEMDITGMIALQELGNRCGRAGNHFQETLDAIVSTAVSLTGAAKGNLQLFDAASSALRIAAQCGFDEPFLDYFGVVKESDCACGTALWSAKRIVIEDITQNDTFAGKSSLDVMLKAGVKAVQSTPLVSGNGRVLGMISTHFTQPNSPAERELRLMDLLARLAADYLERKQAENIVQRAQEELREAHEKLKNRDKANTVVLEHKSAEVIEKAMLLDMANDAIFVKSANGTISYWNQGATRLYGWTMTEALGHSPAKLLQSEYPIPLSEIENRDEWEGEIRHTKRDGTRITVVSRWTKIQDSKGNPAGWLEINTDITPRKRAEASARALSGRILTLQDEERRRIARGLHDSLGQYLTALKMNLDGFPSLTPEQSAVVASESSQIVDKCLTETRTISYLLHPPLLDEAGFGAAARWYVEGFSRRSGIAVNLDLPQERVRLHQDVEIALFRAVQESLTNIHKHANSSLVDIRMTQDSKQVRLEIQDNGQGIPKDRLKRLLEGSAEVGVGIAGMCERFRELGGSLELRSTRKGTTVIVTAPVPQGAAVGSAEDRDFTRSVSTV